MDGMSAPSRPLRDRFMSDDRTVQRALHDAAFRMIQRPLQRSRAAGFSDLEAVENGKAE